MHVLRGYRITCKDLGGDMRNKIKKYIITGAFAVCIAFYVVWKLVLPRFEAMNSVKSKENNSADGGETNVVLDADVRALGATINQVDYDITQTLVTKKLDDNTNKIIGKYPKVQIGNQEISNDFSVVELTIDVKNESNEERLLTTNTNRIFVYDTSKCVMEYEPVLMNPYENSPNSAQHFHMTLQSGQGQNITLYYIMDDGYLNSEKDLQFELNPSGLNKDLLPQERDSAKYLVDFNLRALINGDSQANISTTN